MKETNEEKLMKIREEKLLMVQQEFIEISLKKITKVKNLIKALNEFELRKEYVDHASDSEISDDLEKMLENYKIDLEKKMKRFVRTKEE
jgi:hypothetical protein